MQMDSAGRYADRYEAALGPNRIQLCRKKKLNKTGTFLDYKLSEVYNLNNKSHLNI